MYHTAQKTEGDPADPSARFFLSRVQPWSPGREATTGRTFPGTRAHPQDVPIRDQGNGLARLSLTLVAVLVFW